MFSERIIPEGVTGASVRDSAAKARLERKRHIAGARESLLRRGL